MRNRRRFLRDAGLAGAGALLSGCEANGDGSRPLLERLGFAQPKLRGGFVGQAFERGHRLRDVAAIPAPDATKRVDVAIVGAGISGLAAARALARAGIDDLRLFELEDEAGGNSRGLRLGGVDCPLGAHYLPTPGPFAEDVAELLAELKLRRVVDGKPRYDELTLCQSPQERLFIAGGWQDGLLPVRGQNEVTFAAYRAFAAKLRTLSTPRAFTVPTAAARWNETLAALDAQSFAAWLDAEGLVDPALRWYLDYCCRDDYGAPAANVSAWAGLHYFASRHGFTAPGDASERDHDFDEDGVLTWPEGNAWLARRLAAPFAARTQTGALVLRVEDSGRELAVDVLDVKTQRLTRWLAKQAVIATPLFVAARLVAESPSALREAAAKLPHAPWLVANLHLDEPLLEHAGNAPLSWDNVLYGAPGSQMGLGYVNAMNQSTRPYAGATVLTWYRSFGEDPAAGRRALLSRDWESWTEAIVAELSAAHPDMRGKLREAALMRYGHAMAIPAPGVRGSAWLAALREPQGRLAFAHADLSGYSVFEEAFDQGLRAGRAVAAGLKPPVRA